MSLIINKIIKQNDLRYTKTMTNIQQKQQQNKYIE